MKNIKKLLLLICLCCITILNSGCILNKTQPNEVGVRTKKITFWGKKGVEPKIYAPGSTYFFLPLINDWNTFNTNIQNIEMTYTQGRGDLWGKDDLKFKTIDGNDIALDLVISYRIIPEKAPYILQYIGKNDLELRSSIIRTVARSRPRDVFGELETEEFYKAELRTEKSQKVKKILNDILNPYGILIERVLTKDYRFNTAYQKAIEDKKIADQKTEQNKSATKAKEEEYKRKLEEARGEVNKMVAEVNGEYEQAKIAANAYYSEQDKRSKAIQSEGIAEAKGIRKLNQALAEQGGKVMVKLEMAKALRNKKIYLIPSDSSNSIDLKTLDMNKLIETKGLQKIANDKK